MPNFPEDGHSEKLLPLIPRKQYIKFATEHPGLRLMPKELREDLPAHKDDVSEHSLEYRTALNDNVP